MFFSVIKMVIIPLGIGFCARVILKEKMEKIKQILEEEKIDPDLFRLPNNPELASRGTQRPIRMPIHQLKYELQNDDNDTSQKMVVSSFALAKGSYATVLFRELMKTAPENYV